MATRDHNLVVNPYCLLYTSDIAPDAPPDTVIGIARQARANNARTGITGLLVFDGQHFAQLLEGPEDAVNNVAEKMRADSRHLRMEVLHSAPSSQPKKFSSWRLGYLVLDMQEFGLAGLRGKRGLAAVEAFKFMLPALDMDVGAAVPTTVSHRDPYR